MSCVLTRLVCCCSVLCVGIALMFCCVILLPYNLLLHWVRLQIHEEDIFNETLWLETLLGVSLNHQLNFYFRG